MTPQNQVDRRSKLFVEDSRGNRITKPVVLDGWLYGQEIDKLRQTLTEFFTDPEVIYKFIILLTINVIYCSFHLTNTQSVSMAF